MVVEAHADGLNSMPLVKVLPKADVIVIAEIISNRANPIREKNISGVHSATYSNNIRVKVIKELKSNAPAEIEFVYEIVVIKNLWYAYPGTGSERHMKPGEKYILLFTTRSNNYELLRAENESNVEEIRENIKILEHKVPANKAL